jgi:hypothetical protein
MRDNDIEMMKKTNERSTVRLKARKYGTEERV